MTNEPSKKTSLAELALLFLKIGALGFGGPAAHIAMIREEVVRKKKWISETEFLDYLGAVNLIPGPNSTELAIHIGHKQRGFPGLIVAGASFIFPAMTIVWLIAWAYAEYGTLPRVSGVLYGIKPVIIAIVFQAIFGLTKSSLKNISLAVIGVVALILCFTGVDEILTLVIAGLLALFASKLKGRRPPTALIAGIIASMAARGLAAAAFASEIEVSLPRLFFEFAKIGSVLFGSGYVLLAFLRTEFVEKLHWLTEAQLLDAISIGQFTPGPVFTTATFLGYLMGGNSGALLATLGIFLPAFVFVALSAPLLPRLNRSPGARAFLDGVNVASLALMASVTWILAKSTLVDMKTILLALISGFLLIRYKVNSAWLILAGGLLGALTLGI